MKPDDLYQLSRRDVEQGVAVLAKAFVDYPTFKVLFPDPSSRGERIEHVMRFFIRCGLLRGQALAPSESIEAVAIWYRSTELAFGLNTVIRAGLVSVVRGLGWPSFVRFKQLGDAKKAHRDRIMQEKYWFLDVIGVDPAHVHQGFGRKLIEPMLEQADREHSACYLDTCDQNNIALYEKFGFRLRMTHRFEDLETFCLVRTPQK